MEKSATKNSLNVEGTFTSEENSYEDYVENRDRSTLVEGVKEQGCCLNILEKEDIYNQGELYYSYNVDQPTACNNSPIGSGFIRQINYSCYSDFCFDFPLLFLAKLSIHAMM